MFAFENAILRMIARSAPLEESCRALCGALETTEPQIACSITRIMNDGLCQVLASTESIATICQRFSGGRHCVGLRDPGASNSPTAIHDIATDPGLAEVRTELLAQGWKTRWSVPILDAQGEVTGALDFYTTARRKPLAVQQRWIVLFRELTELAFLRDGQILDRERRATCDALTGLPNRAAFDSALAELSLQSPGAWALFIIDLDHLKVVNDTFGHLAGDAFIATVGNRIAKAVGSGTTFRLGGDEFAVLIQDQEALADLASEAARIFAALEEPATCDGQSILPKATIGGAVVEYGELSASSVYQKADFALYHAKETRRGGFVRYWPGIGTRISRRRTALSELSLALDENRVDAYYQPVVDLASRAVVGVEALCRIVTPQGRYVPPHVFSDAGRDHTVITALTSRMLGVVARDVSGWQRQGLALHRVAVNISTADFRCGGLIEKLDATFGAAGIAPDLLILEINEPTCNGVGDRAIAGAIQELRNRGYRAALDNFGASHASLRTLLTLPVNGIKIDRSIVRQIKRGHPSLSIIEAIVAIADKLDIRLVAEGIETERQASQLAAMGCPLGQGFAFSKPVDRQAITEILANARPHAVMARHNDQNLGLNAQAVAEMLSPAGSL